MFVVVMLLSFCVQHVNIMCLTVNPFVNGLSAIYPHIGLRPWETLWRNWIKVQSISIPTRNRAYRHWLIDYDAVHSCHRRRAQFTKRVMRMDDLFHNMHMLCVVDFMQIISNDKTIWRGPYGKAIKARVFSMTRLKVTGSAGASNAVGRSAVDF